MLKGSLLPIIPIILHSFHNGMHTVYTKLGRMYIKQKQCQGPFVHSFPTRANGDWHSFLTVSKTGIGNTLK